MAGCGTAVTVTVYSPMFAGSVVSMVMLEVTSFFVMNVAAGDTKILHAYETTQFAGAKVKAGTGSMGMLMGA